MPQTRTITKTLYTFDELSDRAKERARDWFRGCTDETDYECVIDDFKTVAEIIGIDFDTHEVQLMGGGKRQDPNIYWSGFASQGDGACFEGSYHHNGDSCAKIREYCWDEELLRITDELARIQAARVLLKQPLASATIKHRGNYYHEHTMDIDVDDVDEDGSCDTNVSEQVSELMWDLARWLYKQLDQQNDYINSDEYIDENIEANDYTFDEEGNRDD